MTNENPIVIEDREELIYMLSEAASLEHMIMCQYLFAAFSGAFAKSREPVGPDVSAGAAIHRPGSPPQLSRMLR